MSQARPASLRTGFAILLVALSALTLGAAAALMLLTTYLHRVAASASRPSSW